jgi:hypothetical protein
MDMLLKGVLIMHVLDPDTGRGIKDLKKGMQIIDASSVRT